MKFRSFLLLGVLVAAVIALAACGAETGKKGGSAKGASEIVVYSGRKEKYIKPVVKKFEEKTGIKVKLLAGDSSQLANQLVEEKNNPRADIFVSNDAGTLGFLAKKGMLNKYKSKATERVRDDLKDRNGLWVGASARARVIMYNTKLVKESEAPKKLMDLTNPKWKGKFGFANSTNESMTGHVSALRIVKGDTFTKKWLQGMKDNDPVVNKSHDPIRDAVADGELSVGLINHYYYAKKKAEGKPVAAIYPDQDDFGTFINVAGLALIKGAKNPKGAKEFIDFCLSDETQKLFAGVNKEMPVVDTVETDEEAKPLDEFKRPDVKLDELGKELDKTLLMMEGLGL